MNNVKVVTAVHGPGSTHWVGDGFPVRNLFPSNGVDSAISPFLLFDYAGPEVFEPTERPRGVDQHPHRGFETVTIAYQGSVEHRDSAGNAGTIGPGDVQWMTAASGIVHEEKHEREFAKRGGTFEMVQLWVNLPRAHKMTAPGYQTLLAANIPLVELGNGGQARVIAGTLGSTVGPARTFTSLNLWDVRLNKGTRAELHLPTAHQGGVALLRGGLSVNGSTPLSGEAQLALFGTGGEDLVLEANVASAFLLLSGAPIDEPVASQGPFVMNTRDEIVQAIDDYRAGRMGGLD
jgi:redox-sensitive bicupin YhaK (pirin superfamily)